MRVCVHVSVLLTFHFRDMFTVLKCAKGVVAAKPTLSYLMYPVNTPTHTHQHTTMHFPFCPTPSWFTKRSIFFAGNFEARRRQ